MEGFLTPETANLIEKISVVLNLIYLFLLIKENIWCWIFGIVGSLLGGLVFLNVNLYSESILYGFFYTLIGIYGWYTWTNNSNEKDFIISKGSIKNIALTILVGIGLSSLLGYFFYKNTDANNPFVDAHTTVFSLIASYMQANKVLANWIFWIIINGVSVGLYWVRGLNFLPWLMVIYFISSFVGLYEWNRRYQRQNAHDT